MYLKYGSLFGIPLYKTKNMEAYLVFLYIKLFKVMFTLMFLFPNLAYQNSVLSYSLLVSNMTSSIHMS